MGKRRKRTVSDVVQGKPARRPDVAVQRQVFFGESRSQCCCCGSLSRQCLEIELAKLALKAFSVWLLHELYLAALHVVEPVAGAVPWMVMMLAQ